MSSSKDPYVVTVTIVDAEEVLAIYTLTNAPRKKGTEVDSLISPNVNGVELATVLRVLSEHTEASYYSSRVKFLSKEARDQMKKALSDEDLSAAPF